MAEEGLLLDSAAAGGERNCWAVAGEDRNSRPAAGCCGSKERILEPAGGGKNRRQRRRPVSVFGREGGAAAGQREENGGNMENRLRLGEGEQLVGVFGDGAGFRGEVRLEWLREREDKWWLFGEEEATGN